MIKTKDVNWLNQNYSSQIGSELNTSVTLPQLMAYLRKCLRLSVNCNQNVDFDDPNYQNQLDMIVKKLHNDWSHPCIPLFKIALNAKLNTNYDPNNDIYIYEFGTNLYNVQQNLGIESTDGFLKSQIRALFSDFNLMYDSKHGNLMVRTVAQKINHYLGNTEPVLAEKYGYVRTDGLGVYQDFQQQIIAIWQIRNNEPLANKVNLPDSFVYTDSKYPITDPIQFALFLHGFADEYSWTSYQRYYSDIIAYQRAIRHTVNKHHLTNQEIELLFNTKSFNNINTLNIINSLKSNLPNTEIEYDKEFNLGKTATVLPNGATVTANATLSINNTAAIKMSDDFENPSPLTVYYDAKLTKGKFNIENGQLVVPLNDSNDQVTEAVFSLAKPIIKSLHVTDGQFEVDTDLNDGELALSFNIKINKIDYKELSSATVLTIKLSLSFNDFINIFANETLKDIYLTIVDNAMKALALGFTLTFTTAGLRLIKEIDLIKLFNELINLPILPISQAIARILNELEKTPKPATV